MSWNQLAEDLEQHAERYNTAATLARADFAESVKTYVLAGGDVPTPELENRFGGIETEAKRDRLVKLQSRHGYLLGQANRCRRIANGEAEPAGANFQSISEHLNSLP